ncbi:hypothetical protein DFH94DRAFT_686673 [Russula ochroleuca]|uniref:Uncharacterized protein n=1 Tax=Russula ochroleuca TaxID=152965 RepID=A0A9P5MPY8_9AGAM|nr:hypothetical protein DFH94DRAFT_686673 [Russula ochroleuca]
MTLRNGCGTGQQRHTDSSNSEKTCGGILNRTAFCTFLQRRCTPVGLASRLRGGPTSAAGHVDWERPRSITSDQQRALHTIGPRVHTCTSHNSGKEEEEEEERRRTGGDKTPNNMLSLPFDDSLREDNGRMDDLVVRRTRSQQQGWPDGRPRVIQGWWAQALAWRPNAQSRSTSYSWPAAGMARWPRSLAGAGNKKQSDPVRPTNRPGSSP